MKIICGYYFDTLLQFLLLKKLKRRRQNTAPVKSPQGKTPQRSRYQRDSTGKYERDDKGKLVRKSSSSGKGPANKKKKKSVENTEENATEGLYMFLTILI